jgi:hypothetical protein
LNFLPRCVINVILQYFPPATFTIKASFQDSPLDIANLLCYRLGVNVDQIARIGFSLLLLSPLNEYNKQHFKTYIESSTNLIYDLRNDVKKRCWSVVSLDDSLQSSTRQVQIHSSATFGEFIEIFQKQKKAFNNSVYLCDCNNIPWAKMSTEDRLSVVDNYKYFSHFRIEENSSNFVALYSGTIRLSDFVSFFIEKDAKSLTLTVQKLKIRMATTFKLPPYLWKDSAIDVYHNDSVKRFKDDEDDQILRNIIADSETLNWRLTILSKFSS